MKNEKVIALFCSDIHLSLTAPVWRSAEQDWFAAQLRPLMELQRLQAKHNCAIFCAGDVFDKWYGAEGKGATELINFAIENLPYMYAIPGQHDLPDHNISEIDRSAFWTLVQARSLLMLSSDFSKAFVPAPNVSVTGFSYGEKIRPGLSAHEHRHTAIIHQYNWIPGAVFKGADKNAHVDSTRKEFNGYDLIVSGDNHNPFDCKIGKTQFWNCGTLLRRHSDERDYKPRIGMLLESGKVIPHYLDTTQDKYIPDSDVQDEKSGFQMDELMQELETLGDAYFDFAIAIQEFLWKHKTTSNVKKILLQAMEKRK